MYDIVITTYSLLAKEIPTRKQEGETPGANLRVEVRPGGCQGRSWSHISFNSLFTDLEIAKGPACEVRQILNVPPVETEFFLLSPLFYAKQPPQ